ncbi:MAG: hypothetical protein M0Z76_02455 [Gammaproteobacteria bacterium]|nr:hypothetical protein [Gammaproteobacteria bacterium]
MRTLDDYALDELKRLYTTLHAALPTAPALMDSEWLTDLQTYLIARARQAQVDVADHAAWRAWLDEDA